jgi:phage replication O-like protein O
MGTAKLLENGFTQIGNRLLERVMQDGFTYRETRIILAVIRYTNGFNRRYAELSVRFLAEATGINFRHVHVVVKKLISQNILLVNESSGKRQSREICVNDDFGSWNTVTGINDKIQTNHNDDERTNETADTITTVNQISNTDTINDSNQKSNISVTVTDNSSVYQKGDKEKKTINKTSKKTITALPPIPDELLRLEGFDELWLNWITHRKEIKRPLTPLAAKLQLDKLIELQNKGGDIKELVNTAIRNGWQGIWELNGGNKNGRNTQSKSGVKSRLAYEFDSEKYKQRERELTRLYG